MTCRTARIISLGRTRLRIETVNEAVFQYLDGRCGEFLVQGKKPNFKIEVSVCEGGNPVGQSSPDLIVNADKGVVRGVFGESIFLLKRTENYGSVCADVRLMPSSFETCLRGVFAALFAWGGDILLHAAGILRKGLVHIFFGPSESGKSTISALTGGGITLSDETMLIYRNKGKIVAQGTPFWGDFGFTRNNPLPFPAGGFYLLHKSDRVGLERLKPSIAAAEIMANIHSAGQDTFSARRIEESVAKIVAKVPCYSLYFTKDERFWREIDALSR